MNDKLIVYINTTNAGALWLTPQREMMFKYSQEWLQYPDNYRLSVKLPLRESAFSTEECYSYFTNILPDGRILESICRKLAIAEENKFDLLKSLQSEWIQKGYRLELK